LISPKLERKQVISAQQFEREVQVGAKCFMFFAYDIDADNSQKDMFVVQEFMKVFPDETST